MDMTPRTFIFTWMNHQWVSQWVECAIKSITRHKTNVVIDEVNAPADDGVAGDTAVGGLGGGGVLGVATGALTTLQIPGPVLPCIIQE